VRGFPGRRGSAGGNSAGQAVSSGSPGTPSRFTLLVRGPDPRRGDVAVPHRSGIGPGSAAAGKPRPGPARRGAPESRERSQGRMPARGRLQAGCHPPVLARGRRALAPHGDPVRHPRRFPPVARPGWGAPGAAQGDGGDERPAGLDRLSSAARPGPGTAAVRGFSASSQPSRGSEDGGDGGGAADRPGYQRAAVAARAGAVKGGPHGDRDPRRAWSRRRARGGRARGRVSGGCGDCRCRPGPAHDQQGPGRTARMPVRPAAVTRVAAAGQDDAAGHDPPVGSGLARPITLMVERTGL